jgi:hypothetical protein
MSLLFSNLSLAVASSRPSNYKKRGKKMKISVLSSLVSGLISIAAMTAIAQDMGEMRSEFFYCSLNEGKTMADVKAQSKAYGEFSKKEGTHYTQAIMTPMHAGDAEYDYITWGTWPNGKAMYDEWGSFAKNYENAAEVVTGGAAGTCRNTISTFFNLVARIPMEADLRDAKRPTQFSRCTLNEDVTLEQVAAQERENVAKMKDAGFQGLAIAYHVPYMGFTGAEDFDFVMNYYWYSFDARAHAAQNYGAFVAQNPEVQESMDKLVSCEGTRSFVFEAMFNNLPPTES